MCTQLGQEVWLEGNRNEVVVVVLEQASNGMYDSKIGWDTQSCWEWHPCAWQWCFDYCESLCLVWRGGMWLSLVVGEWNMTIIGCQAMATINDHRHLSCIAYTDAAALVSWCPIGSTRGTVDSPWPPLSTYVIWLRDSRGSSGEIQCTGLVWFHCITMIVY